MKTIANQKIVTINKERVEKNSGKDRQFLLAYVDTIEKAAKELPANEFKVYIYLLTNLDQFRFGLSPQDISNRYGMNPDTARSAITKLIDKNYLVLLDGDEYMFYDRPERKPTVLPKEISDQLKTKTFMDENGNKYEYTFKQILEMVEDEEQARQIWEGK